MLLAKNIFEAGETCSEILCLWQFVLNSRVLPFILIVKHKSSGFNCRREVVLNWRESLTLHDVEHEILNYDLKFSSLSGERLSTYKCAASYLTVVQQYSSIE